ncbi:hemerythrin domain-containing protein [Nocardioides sp. W7]|uniref:hemerythrin domain-containing protein n=1 Tax=Nocardioides sp. W7 TaxID=2931390 RepID=UPI001FD117CD|nr:hemerythrin domain-containing protein [Nocardioides sp. W7]
MVTEAAPAADPSMIGTAHAAFRRDLARTRIVVAGGAGDSRRTALGEHVLWLMGALHRHHEAEAALYPLVVDHDPAVAPLVATVDAEHGVIAPAVGVLEEAAREFRDGADREVLLAALTGLDSVLLPHLEREEAELVPVAAGSLTDEQWHRWHQGRTAGTTTAAQRALEVHWLIDGADPGTRAAVLARLPAVPRVLHGLRRAYARRFRELWAGTPAARVPALTLQNHADWS